MQILVKGVQSSSCGMCVTDGVGGHADLGGKGPCVPQGAWCWLADVTNRADPA